MTELWFEHEGTRLFAIDDGEHAGAPVILLHGALATHLAVRLWPAAPPPFRLITPDLRASGRSRFAGALTWDLLADDVVAWMDHLGLPRAIVGGSSFGAGVAVRTALRHPARVAGLIVLSPAYGGAELGLTSAQRAAMDAMAAAGRTVLADGPSALYAMFDALPEAVRARARAMVSGFDPPSVATLTRFLDAGVQPFASGADLAAIAAPALLVPGVDATHPPEVSDVYRRHLRRCMERAIAHTFDAPGYVAAIEAFVAGALTA